MWDMKPDAPAEIRGEFRPIASSLPTVSVCEHLPRFARVIQHGTLIRSAHHGANVSHAAAVYCSLTGHDRGEQGGGSKSTDNPAIGSVVGLCRPPRAAAVPYVSLPYITAEGRGGPPQPGFFGGWLGRTYDPLFILGDPNAPDFTMPELTPPIGVSPARLGEREGLLRSLGATPDRLAHDRRSRDMDGFQARAFDLLNSPTTRRAFRLDREDPRSRDRYGRNIYGQSVLLARRLIEAGTRVACISWAPDANATWDTHGQNFAKLKDPLLPQFDAAVSSLIDDLIAGGSSIARSWRSWASSAAAPGSTGPRAANTGTTATASGWPEVGSNADMCTVPPTRSARSPSPTPSPRPRSSPPSIDAWGSRRTSSCATSSTGP